MDGTCIQDRIEITEQELDRWENDWMAVTPNAVLRLIRMVRQQRKQIRGQADDIVELTTADNSEGRYKQELREEIRRLQDKILAETIAASDMLHCEGK